MNNEMKRLLAHAWSAAKHLAVIGASKDPAIAPLAKACSSTVIADALSSVGFDGCAHEACVTINNQSANVLGFGPLEVAHVDICLDCRSLRFYPKHGEMQHQITGWFAPGQSIDFDTHLSEEQRLVEAQRREGDKPSRQGYSIGGSGSWATSSSDTRFNMVGSASGMADAYRQIDIAIANKAAELQISDEDLRALDIEVQFIKD